MINLFKLVNIDEYEINILNLIYKYVDHIIEGEIANEYEILLILYGDKNWIIQRDELTYEQLIDKYIDELGWERISEYEYLSERFIRKHFNTIEKYSLSISLNLSEQFLEKYINKDRNINSEYGPKYVCDEEWDAISVSQQLSEQFLEKYKDFIVWDRYSMFQKLNERILDKFEDKINWFNISRNENLTEQIMIKYKDKLNWYIISETYILSESFIHKFHDKLNMKIVLKRCYKEKNNINTYIILKYFNQNIN